jgi:peptide/nickel transport system ATP-binding protein
LEEILRIEHLKKHFIKKHMFSSQVSVVKAADDVSFYLNKGEVFVLAGESGSGKSTIAKLILKSIVADSGKIIYEGNEIGNDKKR